MPSFGFLKCTQKSSKYLMENGLLVKSTHCSAEDPVQILASMSGSSWPHLNSSIGNLMPLVTMSFGNTGDMSRKWRIQMKEKA